MNGNGLSFMVKSSTQKICENKKTRYVQESAKQSRDTSYTTFKNAEKVLYP